MYEEKHHRNRAMVMICSYMAQMGVNEKMTWRNQCVQHMVLVKEVCEIGARV